MFIRYSMFLFANRSEEDIPPHIKPPNLHIMARKAVPLVLAGAAMALAGLPVQIETRSSVTSRLANIHLSFDKIIDGEVTYTYGLCGRSSPDEAHHVLGRSDGATSHSKRLVWVLPDDAVSGGCISAWDPRGNLVGRSEPQLLHNRHKRRVQKRAGRIVLSGIT